MMEQKIFPLHNYLYLSSIRMKNEKTTVEGGESELTELELIQPC